MKLKKPNVFLRKATLEDVDSEYIEWLTNPKINKFIEKKNSNALDCRRYILKMTTAPNNRMFFMIVDSQRIGTVTISNIDYDNDSCTIGIMIGDEKYLHKGYGKIFLEQILSYIRNELGITNANIGCSIDNIPAIKCYHKVGFKDKFIFMTKNSEEGINFTFNHKCVRCNLFQKENEKRILKKECKICTNNTDKNLFHN